MLVLKRKDGQWIEMTHKSGDIVRFRVYNLRVDFPGQATLAFDDPDRNFEIQRPERLRRKAEAEARALAAEAATEPEPDAMPEVEAEPVGAEH